MKEEKKGHHKGLLVTLCVELLTWIVPVSSHKCLSLLFQELAWNETSASSLFYMASLESNQWIAYLSDQNLRPYSNKEDNQ